MRDTIELAREAGAKPSHNPELWDIWEISNEALKRLVALARADEREASQAPVQEPVATLFGSLPVYDTTPPAAQPDYAWPTIEDYEKEVGFEVNDAFKAAWTMARTTNDLFKLMGEST